MPVLSIQNRKWETFFTLSREKALFWSYHKWVWGLWRMITVCRNLTSDMSEKIHSCEPQQNHGLLITDLTLPSTQATWCIPDWSIIPLNSRIRLGICHNIHAFNSVCVSVIVKFTHIIIENQTIHLRFYDRTFHSYKPQNRYGTKVIKTFIPFTTISEEK